jgi:DNA primase
MDNQVDEIKNKLDLVEIIRGYMKLEKSGANFRGLCPFHHEKTPSLFVSPSRQLWKCFGCSVGGDMFSFIEKIDGSDFKEALNILAEKAGVQLHAYDPKIRSEKTRLYEICEKACQFFERQLAATSLGAEARQYVLGRGISEESITKFRIGFAPYTKSSLVEFLRSQGYSPAEIFKTGVSSENYDRFRSRVMFPISDLNGHIIGFGGRIFFAKNQIPDPKLAKYVNTPQTILYDKSKVLYGIDKAKLKIREHDSAMLVEGYTDLIMAHQAGSENAVATSGTALTEAQLDIIHRYTQNLITAFDMDVAGDTATKRGIDIAQRKGFNIKVISLPEAKDPAEIIQKNIKKWKNAIKEPLSIGDFYFTGALSRFDKKNPDDRRRIADIILPMIKQIPSEIDQSFWIQKLATELKCSESVIWNDLAKINYNAPPASLHSDAPLGANFTSNKIFPAHKSDKLHKQMLLLSIKHPACVESLGKRDLKLFDKNSVPASIILKKHRNLTDEEKKFMEEAKFEDEAFPQFSDISDFQIEFNVCLEFLRRNYLKERLIMLQREMKLKKDDKALLEKFQKTSIELAKL